MLFRGAGSSLPQAPERWQPAQFCERLTAFRDTEIMRQVARLLSARALPTVPANKNPKQGVNL